MDRQTSRRSSLSLAPAAPVAGATLAACGSSGPSGAGASGSGGGGGSATFWFLSGHPQQDVREDTVKRFNSSGAGNITYTEFQNDAYKTKIKTALGAGQGPTIIWGWGGGGLDGDFVTGGHLGYMNFPPVDPSTDKGDPSDTVGNPGAYYSISSKASQQQQDVAKKFFATTVLDDTEIKKWVDAGNAPLIKGADSKFGSGPDADWLKFNYDVTSKAKNFAQSWDQALSPTVAETLLDNIAKLFRLSITSEQWITSMNGTIGK